jgi:hypothetical protein
MSKVIVFSIDGGIGKCIAATAVCRAISKNNPTDQLVVVSGYPEVFVNNPYVYTALHSGNINYFYRDYVEGKDVELMMHNPYMEADYIKERKHLIEIWCDLFKVPYDGEMPELFINQKELDFYQKRYQSDKPIMMMQTNGGANTDLKYSFTRDLPSSAVVRIIDHFADKYNIVHVRREDQLGYQRTTPILSGFREVLSLALLSQKRLLIDSFLQHACAALNLSSTVCWITNNPKVLGYEMHDNILAKEHTVTPSFRNSFLQKFNLIGEPADFPYRNEGEIFDVNKIIESLEGLSDAKVIIPEINL